MNSFKLFGKKIDENSRLYYIGDYYDTERGIKKRGKIISTKLADENNRIRTIKISNGYLNTYSLDGSHKGEFDITSGIKEIEKIYDVIEDINPRQLLLNKIKI